MIGIFDSGSGGLGVLKEIRKRLPEVDVVYLGDIKNAPYGSKSREELGALTAAAVSRLLNEGATKIVSACNSVSAAIVLPMLSILGVKPLDIVEMVGPTVKSLRYERRKILLVATPATVESRIYQSGFAAVGKEIDVLPMADLAGAIEFGASNSEIKEIIRRAFEGVTNFEVLVLGCTHYPLVGGLFEEMSGNRVEVVDPAMAVAEEVSKMMREPGRGETRFIVTRKTKQFQKRVREMFGETIIGS